jgi:hypothetical protein
MRAANETAGHKPTPLRRSWRHQLRGGQAVHALVSIFEKRKTNIEKRFP